ncbi:MAG TPA: hypothetical protein VL053_02060 [Arachidicoccus sp.]|nr:hypothetical protein [Arachidicoccus sp.]
MSDQIIVENVEGYLDEILSAETAFFKVGFKVKPTHNFKVYVDGDQGITIDQCIKINRALYKKIEEAGLFPDGDFSLEVSSPGVDEPLKNTRQYKKNIGRTVLVTLSDEKQVTGVLQAVEEDKVTLEVKSGKGKTAVTNVTELPFQDIKTTIVQIQF